MSGHQALEEMPHYDTLNYYPERLSPECLSELRRKMAASLIRGKQFNRNRLLGKYWKVLLDGTGLFCFKEKHCENCLSMERRTDDGKREKLYYHKILEAKIVPGGSIVISLGTEFIENDKEDVEKQDCEINAAKRLMERLCGEKGRGCYANHVEEVSDKKEGMNVFECEYEKKDKKGKEHRVRLRWISIPAPSYVDIEIHLTKESAISIMIYV